MCITVKKRFLAKPCQSYEEHLDLVYKSWKSIIKCLFPLIERGAEKYCFSRKRFFQGSLLSVAFHDVGKMALVFQEMMLAFQRGYKFDFRQNYRHELVSFLFSVLYWSKINKDEKLSLIPLEALAVVGHHKKIDADMKSFIRELKLKKPALNLDGIEFALEIAKRMFRNENFDFKGIDNKCFELDPVKPLKKVLFEGISNAFRNKNENEEKTRFLYCLLKGILHYSDWHGSAGVDVNYSLKPDAVNIVSSLEKRCREKGLKFNGLRDFQKECADTIGNLIAIAPTGSGKTEASVLWALNNIKDMGGAKIVYLLPTKNTANNIWERLADFFGKDNVGLSHSSAGLFLEEQEEESNILDPEAQGENRSLLFDRSFIRPVTVATVDQLLSIGFNRGHWTVKEINAANAVIIMDEIHAYDSWTLGLILESIKYFSSLGSRFLLMSATMPSDLLQHFAGLLEGVKIIKDQSLLDKSRSKYQVIDRYITESESLKIIEEAALSGKKVLVVVNTVLQCQDLAEKFSRFNPLCYHSMFIMRDRQEIEKKINNHNFVVATQVVEVSLDIDFDYLFTECAPPDALAQRSGRVNRYRDSKRDSMVYIFKASEKSEVIYNDGLNDFNLLKKSFLAFKNAPEVITEKVLIDIVEDVYKERSYEDDPIFNEAKDQYRKSQHIRLAILDNPYEDNENEMTRLSKYETVNAIPLCFKEEVLNIRPFERQKYEVKIPRWYFRKPDNYYYKGIAFCDVTYDKNCGVILKPETIEGTSDSGTTLVI